MRKPKPRDYGLDSDHAPLVSNVGNFGADPNQPFTDEEISIALETLVMREALAQRQSRYSRALAEWDYNNGGR